MNVASGDQQGSGAVGPNPDDVQKFRSAPMNGLGDPAGDFLHLIGQLLDAPGQQPECEDGSIACVGAESTRVPRIVERFRSGDAVPAVVGCDKDGSGMWPAVSRRPRSSGR